MSEALLVPDRCRFLHQEQMDTCKSYVYWHNIAKQVRRKHFHLFPPPLLLLHLFFDVFRGCWGVLTEVLRLRK